MVLIPGGTFTRGDTTGDGEPEERPAQKVKVDAFYLDATEVTNADFLRFTEATGYKTQAERGWSRDDFPKAPASALVPGAMCFLHRNSQQTPTSENVGQRWVFVPGASWQHPQGPDSSIDEILDHPVVCITYEDAAAYAKWAGKRLPTETEWERAARGGIEGETYPWGNDLKPGGKWMANIFQGDFPSRNTGDDGFISTAPVGSFPPNRYDLHDMAGNVWEICSDYFSPSAYADGPTSGMPEIAVQTYFRTGSYPARLPEMHPLTFLRVVRGGSFLCDADYCRRYRNSARFYTESLAPSNHTGFRCAKDL